MESFETKEVPEEKPSSEEVVAKLEEIPEESSSMRDFQKELGRVQRELDIINLKDCAQDLFLWAIKTRKDKSLFDALVEGNPGFSLEIDVDTANREQVAFAYALALSDKASFEVKRRQLLRYIDKHITWMERGDNNYNSL